MTGRRRSRNLLYSRIRYRWRDLCIKGRLLFSSIEVGCGPVGVESASNFRR